MKICPTCGAQVPDDAGFCPNCGAPVADVESIPAPAAAAPAYDHTAEFDPADISENKVIAMLVYLLDAIGIIIALLASSTSKYAGFHVRQALKITVLEILLGICCIIPILGWIAAGVGLCVLLVVKVIAFVQICQGKAVEPVIVRSFGFLK